MYYASNLDAESMSFINFLAGPRASKKSALVALAKALSDKLSLPSSQLQIDAIGIPLNPEKKLEEEQMTIGRYYRSNHSIAVREKLSVVNELVALDTDVILDYVEKLYIARYYMLYPAGKIFCVRPDYAVLDFFGIGTFLDEETVKSIAENPLELTRIYNGSVDFFARLDKGVA